MAGLLGLTQALQAAVLIDQGDRWRYHLGTNEASLPDLTAWRGRGFDDSSWAESQAPFGYANPPNHPAESTIATPLPSSQEGGYLCVFFRKTFLLSNVADIGALHLSLNVDDGWIGWLNGTNLDRINLADGEPTIGWTALVAGEPTETALSLTTNLGQMLFVGTNVLAIQVFNAGSGSSDLFFEASLVSEVDQTPPLVVEVSPPPGAAVRELTQLEVFFDSNVRGVDATDLLINGQPATNLTVYSPRDYLFKFPQPPVGTVQVAWVANHGITDLASSPNAFAGGNWTYQVQPGVPAPTVIISEFMADNEHGIRDDDANRSDWIEILNLGPGLVDFAGWFLTDTTTNLTKWRFPAVSLDVGKFLLVWASGNSKTNPLAPLHLNFKLEKNGGYLALLDPRTNVVFEFAPYYPPQRADVSYGCDRANPSLTGYFFSPTPGAPNVTAGPGFAPPPQFSLEGGVYTSNSLTVTLTAPAGTIRYTLDGSVPATNSPTYSSPLQFSANTMIKARVFLPGLLPSDIAAQQYILLDRSLTNFSSNLPLLIIETGGRGIAQDVPPGQLRTPAALLAIDTFRGRSSLLSKPDFRGLCELEIRGQSSSGFPKRPYNLETQDAFRNDLDVPLLGLPADSDWALYNPYTDKPFIQNFLAFELHEKMGHYAVRRRFFELFVETTKGRLTYPRDYAGIYMLQEKIKIADNRVRLQRLSAYDNALPDISGGYIIKKDKDSTGDKNFGTTGGAGFSGQSLKIHDPKPREITTAQLNWIRDYLVRFEKALYATDWTRATGTNHYSWYIDVDSFVDNHWIVEFSKQIDGYRLSNFLHKDRGGKLKMEPIWDWNLSFGNADYLEGWQTSGWYYPLCGENDHPWLRRLICGTTSGSGATGDPDFNQRIIDRWSELRTNVLSASNVVARVDELAAMLTEAADRDFQKWPRLGAYVWPNPSFYVTPRTYEGIIAAMNNWIRGRFAWIDGRFVRSPSFNVHGGPVPAGFSLTITAPAGTIYYTLDGTDPRLPGGGISSAASPHLGPIPINANARAVARARSANGWSGPTAATFVVRTPPLAITEIMYHPAPPPPGGSSPAGDFEYVELANLDAKAFNLVGCRIRGAVEFTFPDLVLGAGRRVLVVRNRTAFISRYGAVWPIAGEYVGALANARGRLILEGRFGEPIQDLVYQDDWYRVTDGVGFSLTPVNEAAPADQWPRQTAWRPSSLLQGSPGEPDSPPPSFPPVVISEALTHTDPPAIDAIELQNLSDRSADIGGWFLSDDPQAPKKFRLPDGLKVGPGGFVVFTEDDFNSPAAALVPFALDSAGDQVYLFSGDAHTNLTGYCQGFAFGAQRAGVTFGRHVTSLAEEHFVAQAAPTLGTDNVGPLVGPVVISELMYRPADVFANGAWWNNTEDEYVELLNCGREPAPLFDPAYPVNPWRLTGGIAFTFPLGVSLPPGGYLLVVSFDPAQETNQLAAFKLKYAVPDGVPILGPCSGHLDNRKDTVALERPDTPELAGPNAGQAPYVLVEQVRFSDEYPWPAAPDGIGFGLNRRDPARHADDPANWEGAPPSPGQPRVAATTLALTLPPQSRNALVGNTVNFEVRVNGLGPLRYQWRFNGENLAGATNSTLTLTNVQPAQAGAYAVVVLNPATSLTSESAWLGVETDADGDGLGDGWELACGLDPYRANEPAADPDKDGLSNLAEYVAGTNPLDPQSCVKFDRIAAAASTTLWFSAVSNRTYTVQYTDSLNRPVWNRLLDFPGQPATRSVSVTDHGTAAQRYYRLVTPRQP
jgi:hypothetical protein